MHPHHYVHWSGYGNWCHLLHYDLLTRQEKRQKIRNELLQGGSWITYLCPDHSGLGHRIKMGPVQERDRLIRNTLNPGLYICIKALRFFSWCAFPLSDNSDSNRLIRSSRVTVLKALGKRGEILGPFGAICVEQPDENFDCLDWKRDRGKERRGEE